MLYKTNQREKAKYRTFLLICGIRPEVMKMMMMGHECKWGTVSRVLVVPGRVKERILRGEEDGSMLHIYK
jgi:hypothetical protein